MSAATPRPPAWSYMIEYPSEGNAFNTAEAALSCASALQRVAILMAHGMKAKDIEEDGDAELLEHVSLYGWVWTRRASELLAVERAAVQARETPPPAPPPPPDVIPISRRGTPVRATRGA